MTTDEILTMAIYGILFVPAIITPLCSCFFRMLLADKKSGGSSNNNATTPLSIIITAHDQGAELERNLPVLLSQAYKPGFEVIVVDESSTDNTDDVLTRLKSQYPNLYTTFIPSSSHYLSRRKLAITVGIKAAKNEWLILTDACCRPEHENWLDIIACHCTERNDIVLGYTGYEHQAGQFCCFEQLLTTCYFMRKAMTDTAYRYSGSNLAIRKSVFMEHNGFLRNLKYMRGEYDFLVNEYATSGHTAVVTSKDAIMRQEVPSQRSWTNHHLYYMETRKHLQRSLGYRALFNVDTTLLYANYITQLMALLYGISSGNVQLASIAILCILLSFGMRIIVANKVAKRFGEHFSLPLIPLMELRVVWQNLWFMLRHRMADKYDFIRK